MEDSDYNNINASSEVDSASSNGSEDLYASASHMIDFPYYIEGVGILVVSVIGMGLNGLAVFVLSRQKRLM